MVTLIQQNYEDSVLDLYDISLILNYERASTEPRFRHAKLREVATTSNFKTIKLITPAWQNADPSQRVGFVFDAKQPPKGLKSENEPDLPLNMIPHPNRSNGTQLTGRELETYYWQARNHDGCYTTVALFQHFIDLFPDKFTRVRVRTVDKNGIRNYSTLASDRVIVEMELIEPSSYTLSAVLPENKTYISGGQDVINHAVLGFSSPGVSNPDTILDLSSLQFGDVGRGNKGRGLFVLESVRLYISRLDNYAKRNTFQHDPIISQRIGDTPHTEWLMEVAQRAKIRWDNRATTPWCGHCGAPPLAAPLKTCSRCRKAHYCDEAHQTAAWTFHKHFCVEEKKANDKKKAGEKPAD